MNLIFRIYILWLGSDYTWKIASLLFGKQMCKGSVFLMLMSHKPLPFYRFIDPHGGKKNKIK